MSNIKDNFKKLANDPDPPLSIKISIVVLMVIMGVGILISLFAFPMWFALFAVIFAVTRLSSYIFMGK